MLVTKNSYAFFLQSVKEAVLAGLKEQESASYSLKAIEVTVCAICWKEEDDEHTSQDIEWISCSKCELWIHKACLNPDQLECDEYVCERCH